MTQSDQTNSEYRPPLWREAWGSWWDPKRGVHVARHGSPYYKLSDPLGAGLPMYLEAIGWAAIGWLVWRSRR